MTEILLLGTFHFEDSIFDFSSDKIQDEMDSLTQNLARFNPDAIAVEVAIHQQDVISKLYNQFNLEDLKIPNKVSTENLGGIYTFGERKPITYKNELVQIGYKLGKWLNLDDIYAIDDDTELDESAERLIPFLTDALEAMNVNMSKHDKDSIVELYRHYNSAEWSRLNHNIYIQANAIKLDGSYAGVEMNTKWYERNLKIFANIQQVAANCERLFIIYGAGHLQHLRDLIKADDNLKLVDIYEYL